MIKIKIFNPVVGKNRISFQGFLIMQNMLRDYSIELTESDDFDYAFLGADDILNKSIGLEESIEYGLKNIDKYARGGDCFIFDGSDSTSLMGSYEVLEQSDAKFLFKNQLLKTREDYKKKTSFNKWFFGNGSDLDLGYDIGEMVNCNKLIPWMRISNVSKNDDDVSKQTEYMRFGLTWWPIDQIAFKTDFGNVTIEDETTTEFNVGIGYNF